MIWRYCKYIIDILRKDISKALNIVKYSTILRYYKNYFKNIDLYKEKVVYETGEWKKLTSRKKI